MKGKSIEARILRILNSSGNRLMGNHGEEQMHWGVKNSIEVKGENGHDEPFCRRKEKGR